MARPPRFASALDHQAQTVFVFDDFAEAFEQFKRNQKFSDPVPLVWIASADHDWSCLRGKTAVCFDETRPETVRQMLRDGAKEVFFINRDNGQLTQGMAAA